MSYFNTDGNQTTDQTTQGTETQNQQQDFVSEVVKTKGDSWADPQVLAKGKLEADSHISNLENQLQELRSELDKQDYAKELLANLQNNKGTPSAGEVHNNASTNGNAEPENTTPKFSEDELKNLIMSTMDSRETETVRTKNLNTVDAKLTELFGTEVGNVMDQRSTELGMSKERLQEIAGESPQAFFRLMGEAPAKEANPLPSGRGTLNTSAEAFTKVGGERDWAYYQNLRRTNRSEYYSPRVQKQLFQDKLRMGDKFGNT